MFAGILPVIYFKVYKQLQNIRMSEQEKQENQKTIVAFAAGLLIGGLLVWVFGGTPNPSEVEMTEETETEETQQIEEGEESETDTQEAAEETTAPVAVLQTGEGDVDIDNQDAGTVVALNSATFPSDEGWVGVRDYANNQLGGLLGVARYSKEQGLVPQEVILQRATVAGNTYAIVFYSENGDRSFSLTNDTQIEGVAATFEAN